MAVRLPDPKEIVSSVVNGGIELAEGPVKIAEGVADVAKAFATGARANLDKAKGILDDPSVIPDIAMKGVGQTVQAGLGLFEAVGGGVMSTVDAVKNQIRRVAG